MSESDLHSILAGCLNGQRKEQHQLYQFLAPQLMKVCVRYTSDTDVAKDYLQEALIKIFHKIADYRHEGPFIGWAKRVAVNTVIDSIRRNGALMRTISIDEIRDINNFATVDDTSSQLDYLDVAQLVNFLPDAKKVVFNLYAIEGYTHKEIAEHLQISEGTSKSQLHKARELLSQMHVKINKKSVLNEDIA